MTIFFSNAEIQIYRRRRRGSSHRYAMSATFTSYIADIQPASQERIEFVQGRIGKTFTAFVDASVDIMENDQVHVGDKVYSVKAVSKWQGAGLLDHIELVLASLDG